jgi:hypothetical protein
MNSTSIVGMVAVAASVSAIVVLGGAPTIAQQRWGLQTHVPAMQTRAPIRRPGAGLTQVNLREDSGSQLATPMKIRGKAHAQAQPGYDTGPRSATPIEIPGQGRTQVQPGYGTGTQ